MTDGSKNFSVDHFLIEKSLDGVIRMGDNISQGETLAEVCRGDAGWVIRDMGGEIPVLVNNRVINGRFPLHTGNTVTVGDWSWRVPSTEPSRFQGMSIRLDGVTRSVRTGMAGKRLVLLADVSLDVKAGEFIGILGSSGSGKSTLLKIMNGDYAPSQGRVWFDGVSSEEFLTERRRQLAYLPQDPIIHESLTPRSALGYLAELQGVTSKTLVVDTLNSVEVGSRADTPIRKLSGGERKRVALAASLLADPSAIFLDEATSGLDPALEGDMMRLFRNIADSGRTVICITHFPQNVSICDRLIVVVRGKIDFYGTPEQLKAFYNVAVIEDIYPLLSELETGRNYVATVPDMVATTKVDSPNINTRNPASPSSFEQVLILLSRYVRILACNFGNVVLLILQAPVIALLVGATFGNIAVDYPEQHAADWKQVAFLLIMSVIWCAGTNGVREIVKERSIFFHERRYGISEKAYMLSKFVPLGIIGVIQAVLLLIVLGTMTHFAGNWILHGTILSLVALAATAMGLLVSAGVKTSESAMTLLPVILIAQGVLSGGLARLKGGVLLLAEIIAPSYWGLCGLKDTLPSRVLDATFVSIPGEYQPPILGRGPPIWLDLSVLCIMIGVMLWIGGYLLKKAKID